MNWGTGTNFPAGSRRERESSPSEIGASPRHESSSRESGTGPLRTVSAVVLVAVVATYPFLVVAGLDVANARVIGVALLGVAVLAALASGGHASDLVTLLVRRFGIFTLAAVAAAATNHPVALTLLPSLSSLWLLAMFAATLRREPTIVAQFATTMHDGFPDFLLPYCRKVTWLWCVFFASNAAVSAALALYAEPSTWAWYTGFVAYVLMGLLAAGEYVFHKSRFRFYEDGWADRIWKRLLPPEGSALGRRTLAWQIARGASSQERGRLE
jgi:uncharacterized membrane protein